MYAKVYINGPYHNHQFTKLMFRIQVAQTKPHAKNIGVNND